MRRSSIVLLAAAAALVLAVLTACGGGTTAQAGHPKPVASKPMPSMGGMNMPSPGGPAATVKGYTLSLGKQSMSGMGMPLTFTISKQGQPVTRFDPDQTKLLHFYVIRADLTGFQHLHPSMNAQGTWSIVPSEMTAGTYRIYTQFLPHAEAKNGPLVLSVPMTVPGAPAANAALPAPSATTQIDGYTLTLGGPLKAGAEAPLRITITHAGKPVNDLQPYLNTYAHVTAIHQGDLAFAHLHPAGTVDGNHGGPTLTVNAVLPEPGRYRMFIQFQTAGQLHTAPITVSVS